MAAAAAALRGVYCRATSSVVRQSALLFPSRRPISTTNVQLDEAEEARVRGLFQTATIREDHVGPGAKVRYAYGILHRTSCCSGLWASKTVLRRPKSPCNLSFLILVFNLFSYFYTSLGIFFATCRRSRDTVCYNRTNAARRTERNDARHRGVSIWFFASPLGVSLTLSYHSRLSSYLSSSPSSYLDTFTFRTR